MQHMADTISVVILTLNISNRGSNRTHGVPLETTLNTLLFSGTRLSQKLRKILSKLKWMCAPPQPGSGTSRGGRGGNHFQPYRADLSPRKDGSRSRSIQKMAQSQDMPAWRNFGNKSNFTRGRCRGLSATRQGSFIGKN